MPLQIRRGTEAERQLLASPPVSGELIWITDDYKLYIGDGTTLAKDLAPVTGYGDANARDAAASIFTAGTHSGISFSYNGATAIDATVSYPALLQNLNLNNFDLTGTGNINIDGYISATAFRGDYKGTISSDDSTILIDAVNGSINLNGTVKGDIIPAQNESYDLGSVSNRFKDLYLSGTSLFLGNAQLTSSGSAIELPAGSTIAGVPIATSELVDGTNHNINIVGDDSTLLVNVSTGTITAPGGFVGNVTGNVTGVITGTSGSSIIGNVTGDLVGSVFGDDSTMIVDGLHKKIQIGTIESYTFTRGNRDDTLTFGATDHSQTLLLYAQKRGMDIQMIKQSPGSYDYAMQIFTSQGTHDAPATVGDSEHIGGIMFNAYNGSVYDTVAAIDVTTVGTVSGSAIPAALSISIGNFALNPSGVVNTVYLPDGGLLLPQLASAPGAPVTGAIYVADGTGWDPGSHGAPHPVMWDGAAFQSLY